MDDLPWASIEAFRSNFAASESDNEHLLRCWKRSTNCHDCLELDECSWCPFTWSCVPNPYNIQLLAPAYNEQVCPHWAERWELRTQSFGCQVSTITSLTSIVSIVSSLVAILLVFVLFAIGAKVRRIVKDRRKKGGLRWNGMPSWRRFLRRGRAREDGERDALLPQSRNSEEAEGSTQHWNTDT